MKLDSKQWLKFSVINLLLVAFLGVLMRYKIGFEFPYFSQKNLQHAHSHFAFVGWISQTLYVLMISSIQNKVDIAHYKQYRLLLIANLISAYGMLISFAIQGYGAVSIMFSVSTIVIACFYAFYFFRDLQKMKSGSTCVVWFKVGLWFNILSSLGTFYLAYMMISKHFNDQAYLAAVYFYLHFQYNGFFIFACMGLVYGAIRRALPGFEFDKNVFNLFFVSFFPAYFLSVLWADIPAWLYVIVVAAALTQLVGWIKFIKATRKSIAEEINLTGLARYLFLYVAIAFSIKLILQFGSVIPVVSKLAFGFRPVVMAYLHLVLLAVISVFLLSYLYTMKLISNNKLGVTGLIAFVIGVFFNELVLGVQGVASFGYLPIPGINKILFFVSLLILVSLIVLVIAQKGFSSASKSSFIGQRLKEDAKGNSLCDVNTEVVSR